LEFVPTVDVDDGELLVRGVRRALVTVMPEMTDISEGMEGDPVKESVPPALKAMSMKT
jgi:hypothetical protein